MRIRGLAVSIAFLLALSTQSGAQQSHNVAIVGHESLGGKCVDVPNGEFKSGVRLIMSRCDHGPNQAFALDPATSELRISGLCLDAFRQEPNAGKAGNAVGLWTCHGGPNQQWKLQKQGNGPYVTLVNGASPQATPLCLDISRSDPRDGAPLLIWTCHGGPNQLFMLR